MSAWDIPSKKTAGRGQGAGTGPKLAWGDQLTGQSASGPRTPTPGPGTLGVGRIQGDGTRGSHWLLFGLCPSGPSTTFAQCPCHPICLDCPLACSVFTGGLLLDPYQAVHKFRYLGTPPYSYFLGICSGLSTVSDMILTSVTIVLPVSLR